MAQSLELAVLSDVVARLESVNLEYMLTGSVAMNYYAQPRMTLAIDIVIALSESDSQTIVDIFEDDYYLSSDAVNDAIRSHTMFNLVHYDSVVKVDFIVRKESEYRPLEFNRRQQIRIDELTTWIVSKEDLILSKLSWAKDSRSEMQFKDVENLLATKPDLDYLRKWSPALGLDQLLQESLNE